MIHLFPCGENDQKYILQTAGRMNIFLDGQTNGRITNVLSTPDFYLYLIDVCVWGGGGGGRGGVSDDIYVQMLTLLIPIDLPTTFMVFSCRCSKYSQFQATTCRMHALQNENSLLYR